MKQPSTADPSSFSVAQARRLAGRSQAAAAGGRQARLPRLSCSSSPDGGASILSSFRIRLLIGLGLRHEFEIFQTLLPTCCLGKKQKFLGGARGVSAFQSIDCRLALADVYEKVELSPLNL